MLTDVLLTTPVPVTTTAIPTTTEPPSKYTYINAHHKRVSLSHIANLLIGICKMIPKPYSIIMIINLLTKQSHIC